MKKILLLITFSTLIVLSSQTAPTPCGYPRYRNFYYSYDENGNRIQREYVLVCTTTPTEPLRLAKPDSLFYIAQTDTTLKSKSDNTTKTSLIDNIELRNIYPNPTHGNCIVQLSGFVAYVQFQIYDISGNILLNDSFSGIEWNIDLSLLPAGEYTLVIRTKDGKTYNKKIIKI